MPDWSPNNQSDVILVLKQPIRCQIGLQTTNQTSDLAPHNQSGVRLVSEQPISQIGLKVSNQMLDWSLLNFQLTMEVICI